MRPTILLTALLSMAPLGARGAPPKAPPPPRLATCEGLLERFQPGKPPLRAEPVGPDGTSTVWHVAASANERWLVFLPTADDSETPCEVRRIGRAVLRTHGELTLGNPGQEKAYFLDAPEGCDECDMVAAVRGKADTPLAAARLGHSCDMGVTVTLIRLFDGVDSLAVRCRDGIGAGSWNETLLLLHVVDGALRTVLTGDMGTHEERTQQEREDGDCEINPVGWLRVRATGARPTVELLEPRSDDMVDGRGTTAVYAHVYDPEARAFVRTGKPTPTSYDMRGPCRRD